MIAYFCQIVILIVSFTQINTYIQMHLKSWSVQIIKCPYPHGSIGKSFPTTIPSNIHLDLFNHKQINQQFDGDLATSKWIQQCTIEYSNQFILTEQLLANPHFKIIFQGIDTYSTITINNHHIFNTSNPFIKYSKLVKDYLLVGNNSIIVTIHPQPQLISRKPYYQLGTQFNPTFKSMGIWRKVYLIAFQLTIDYVWIRNRYITQSKAILNFAVNLEVDHLVNLRQYAITIKQNQNILAKEAMYNHLMYIDVQIDKPLLWWPNGVGNPNLYHFNITINKGLNIIQSKTIIYGIKTVQLIDSQIHINGYPIYIKGSTYYPPDLLYPRATPNTIQSIINSAVESNFNMLRVLGQYQSEYFYEMCSRKGLMVFQDLMFVNKEYPSDINFLMSVEEQLKHNIKRIRNYPCLTIWSANNQPTNNQHPLFHILIPKVLEYANPQVPFLMSLKDLNKWNQQIDGFNRQFSIQGLPVWHTIKLIDTYGTYDSPNLLFDHPEAFNNLRQIAEEYGKPSITYQLDAYQSGIIQAYLIELAIKAQRAFKPNNWGTLYSMFNDVWPTVSPSTIDYFNRWKPAQYILKRYYPSIAIYYYDSYIIAINDKLVEIQAITNIKLMDFFGKLILNQTQIVKLSPNGIKQIFKLNTNLLKGKEKQVVLIASITAGKNDEMTTTHFFTPLKELQLPESQLHVNYDMNFNVITLKATNFIKSLQIYNQQYIQLSDNYFDLIPGKLYKIALKQKRNLSDLKSKMKFRSYKQIYSHEDLKVYVDKQI